MESRREGREGELRLADGEGEAGRAAAVGGVPGGSSDGTACVCQAAAAASRMAPRCCSSFAV
jgi:hypothetical protein